MSTEDANTYMKTEKIDFATVCNTAESQYKTARDNGEWGPSKLPVDGKTVPAAFVTSSTSG